MVRRARVQGSRLRKRSRALRRDVGRRLAPDVAYLDLLGDPARSVLVLGSARSGTTKLAEVLASARNRRLVFEPMNPGLSPFTPPGFVGGSYRRPGEPDPELLTVWTRILSGRIRSPWTDSRNHARLPTRRVVKCISSNNLAEWLRHRFPDTRIVFVHRHPLAVAGSILDLQGHADGLSPELRQRWTPDTMRQWVAASGLLVGPLAHHAPQVHRLLDRERTDVEDRVLRWCMENAAALERPPATGFLSVRYEDLLVQPEEELRRIGRFADLDVEQGLRDFDRPSSTDWATGLGNRDGSRRDRRDGWRERMSPEDRDAGMAVVEAFGLGDHLDSA